MSAAQTPLGKRHYYTRHPMPGSAHHEYRMFTLAGALIGRQVSVPCEGDAIAAEAGLRSYGAAHDSMRTRPQHARRMGAHQ